MSTHTAAAVEAAEADALLELGDEIATLAAHLHAATHRLLTLIVEFDGRRGWELEGHCSCAHWLAHRTGIDLGAAREKVRAARALEHLPQISAAMARGELSFAKVRSLTRVAAPASETELLEFARTNTAAQLERLVRSYRRNSRLDEAEQERNRHGSRTLSVFPDDDGMYLIRGRVDPEVGALLMRAIEAAGDALYRAETTEEVEPAQRRADAIGLLAERALAAGFGPCAEPAVVDECHCDSTTADTQREETIAKDRCDEASANIRCDPTTTADGRDATTADDQCDATRATHQDAFSDDHVHVRCCVSEHDRVPISGTRAERYQVMLHVEPAALQWGRGGGRAELEDGTHLSAETSRRLTCDASVVRVLRGSDGNVLDVGRRTRTISPPLRRALEVRDRGCCFPGCGLRFTDGHHIVHWADQGRTSLSNCCLLCRYHHRLVHEGGYRVEMQPNGRPTFYNPRGLPIPDSPPRIRLYDGAAEALVQQNLLRGIEPDFATSAARYRREDDIPWPTIVRVVAALDASTGSERGA